MHPDVVAGLPDALADDLAASVGGEKRERKWFCGLPPRLLDWRACPGKHESPLQAGNHRPA